MLVCAELNYRFIETPLRRRGAEIARRKLAHLETESAPQPLRPSTPDILPGAVKE
jgi:peptidoglycan/LPS O-acetylase OafA/YrhL